MVRVQSERAGWSRVALIVTALLTFSNSWSRAQDGEVFAKDGGLHTVARSGMARALAVSPKVLGTADATGYASAPLGNFVAVAETQHMRIVEMAAPLDPMRPARSTQRALEVPAVQTTAFLQGAGMPVRSCIHRVRMPSRVSSTGDVSFKLQWFLGCRFQ
jgi:hypothetical protein